MYLLQDLVEKGLSLRIKAGRYLVLLRETILRPIVAILAGYTLANLETSPKVSTQE